MRGAPHDTHQGMRTLPRLLYELRELPWPADWETLFGRDAPLIVELGFGNGRFLADLARRHPEANLVGVERAVWPCQRTEARLRKAGLTNVRLVHGEAQAALAYLFRPGTIQALYINFPDPWPKDRHAHRRLITPAFIRLVADQMAPGGRLTIATDVAEYAEQIAAALEVEPRLVSAFERPWVPELPGRTPTKYEEKAIAAGRPRFYFLWRRQETPPPRHQPVPIPEEVPMPHVTLRAPLTVETIARAFRPIVWREGEVIIRLRRLYRAWEKDELLIEAVVVEGPLTQIVGLLVYRQSEGTWLVRPSPVGQPRPTPGLKAAVARLARWLQELVPESEVVYSNVAS
ncbi:MAG TPA: tRNA (guanosine(46)-N7)-methyltransferase TrmB [Chloroflexi bacterium]|nr:tRNA (guanosine(46)-N7)-methyltransferase TrmB [Chloroflexota bacterium]